jgi:hypothetical protein
LGDHPDKYGGIAMKKIFAAVLWFCLFVGMEKAAGAEGRYVRLEVTGTNVNVRAEPDTGSRVLIRANPGDEFIAEAEPVTSPDGMKWYRIIMTAGNKHAHISEDGRFGVEPMYVSANFTRATRLDNYESNRVAEILANANKGFLAIYGSYVPYKTCDVNGKEKVPANIVSSLTLKENNTYELVFENGSMELYHPDNISAGRVEAALENYGNHEWQFNLIDDRNAEEPSYVFDVSVKNDGSICVLWVPQGVGDDSWLETADFWFLKKQ